MSVLAKAVLFCGQPVTIVCDGRCHKAFGSSDRPRRTLSEDEDDFEWLSDGEVGEAPRQPTTVEGGEHKPQNVTDPNRQNRWCARECERSVLHSEGWIVLPDFSRPIRNIFK